MTISLTGVTSDLDDNDIPDRILDILLVILGKTLSILFLNTDIRLDAFFMILDARVPTLSLNPDIRLDAFSFSCPIQLVNV